MPYAFHFRGETVIYATLAPLLPPPLPRLRGSPQMQNIHDIKKSVNTVTRKLNIDVQFSVTFVTFETVSFWMCTQLHRNESLKPSSLWHSQLLKSSGFAFTSAANALRHPDLRKHCGRKYILHTDSQIYRTFGTLEVFELLNKLLKLLELLNKLLTKAQ